MTESTHQPKSDLPSRKEIRLIQEEVANLLKLLDEPYRNAARIAEAHKRVSGIPHRESPDCERL